MKLSGVVYIIVMTVTIDTAVFSLSLKYVQKRALQKSHEKPQWQMWSDVFLGEESFDQVPSLVQLIRKISIDYLSECTPIVLYDRFAETDDNLFLEKLFRNFPLTYIHGQITTNYSIKDVMRCRDVIGEQHNNKVIVVARSTQWRVFEFLSNERSQSFTNLMVIAKSERIVTSTEESSYILYTHKLYMDALGSSQPWVLTSWIRGKLSRPEINLFPTKMSQGFNGHRFIISIANQPPFVIRKGRDVNGEFEWDGIEIRLIELLSRIHNFTTDFRFAKDEETLGSSNAVAKQVYEGRANLGAAGLYTTQEKINEVGMSQWHSQDCAAFITITSTALPRYRAILGPFHWTVWMALTIVYLVGIFPLAFSEKHTLTHLMKNPEEIENMFWYVFGTFTNCFTFTGKASWSKGEKMTTRLLIGFYWIFTIIITACYTGSIIAFVTLPIYPSVIDTVEQLLSGRYQIGTLEKGGWQYWFTNSSDEATKKLLRKLDLVPSVELGLKNTTKAFFWPYAFLGSRAQLDFIVRTNFSTTAKRALLHISKECLVQFNVALVYPKNSIYQEVLNKGVLLSFQSGLLKKLKSDMEWSTMRSATGKLLSANSNTNGLKALVVEDRALTLDDTQGMFLLLGIGFVAGGIALFSEWLGGCFHLCKRVERRLSQVSIESNPRIYESLTPRQKIDSIQYYESILLDHKLGTNNIEAENDLEDYGNNVADFIVHNSKQECSNEGGQDRDTNFEKEINEIFENLFGEETVNTEGEVKEETLIDGRRII